MEYVIQIQVEVNGLGIGWLAKSFEVSASKPVPVVIPASRIQVVMTNTASYNAIVAIYDTHTTSALFSQNGTNIDCTGAVTDSWPID